MNREKVWFSFFMILALTLNFGFFYGEINDAAHHNVYELFAVIVVNLIATIMKFGDRTQMGAMLLAISQRQFTLDILQNVMRDTLRITSMVFLIFIGASLFSLVFRGFGGDDVVRDVLTDLPGGVVGAMFIVMLVMFLLGFILDFIEITFVMVPLVAPILFTMGIDPVWLGIMFAINLQTSFLTPPFGFALFYLRGVAPKEIPTSAIYRGVVPFIAIQIVMMAALVFWPELATWLPNKIYGS